MRAVKPPGVVRKRSSPAQSTLPKSNSLRSCSAALSEDELRQRAPGGIHELATPLLLWFVRARRELPWRTNPRDPYRTWLSEVMLQQTRVEVMVPYYLRFLTRFPTLESLARAPIDDVLARWSGLGYYARARNLHRAAQEALSLHGGLPDSLDALRELPGFGPYTSAAVASLCFGIDAALVDGNVARVLARALGLPGDVEAAKKRSWELAPALLPEGRAGEFNEALMELGATICTPRAPRCGACPLSAGCVSYERGDQEETPAPKPQKARRTIVRAAIRLERKDGQVLLARQPAGALFEGLWDLPALDLDGADPQRVREAATRLSRALGARGALVHLGRVEQTLTHREMRVEIFLARAARRDPARRDPALRWSGTSARELARLGLSSLARKSLRMGEKDL